MAARYSPQWARSCASSWEESPIGIDEV
jgi:hypothetical protein